MKALQTRTRTSKKHYNTIRNEANKICRQKRKKWINNKLAEIEDNYKKNETRKFFETAKSCSQVNSRMPLICKDLEGNVLTENDLVLKRWKEYFSHIFNTVAVNDQQLLLETVETTINQCEIPIPTFNEVCYVINKLKCNKAGGSDNICPELVKYGGRTLKHSIHELIKEIWNKEELPTDWNEGIICPIYKKGNKLDCNNHRPITLLNIGYKIFAILLNNRLTTVIENKLGEYQMGFRPHRSTIDNIFIIRQIFEKCYEHNIDLYNIFIDYTQAFDSVNRNVIIESLIKNEIPSKLIKLIALTLNNTKARVKVNNQISEDFRVVTGVKQGDPLSATLFSIVIDMILKQLDSRGNISTRTKQCLAYADDIVLTTRTKQSAIETFLKLKEYSAQFGLVINEQKTKYLRVSRRSNIIQPLDGVNIEQVNSFKYLGSIVNSTNSIEEEIKNRIALGNKAFYANLSLLKSKLVSKISKLKLYFTVIRPVVA